MSSDWPDVGRLRFFIREQLLYFFQWKGRNVWLLAGPLEFYVSKNTRRIDGMLVQTFDITTVHVEKQHRGCGIFTVMIEEVEALGMNVFIENIVNLRLFGFFEERGYVRIGNNMFKRAVL